MDTEAMKAILRDAYAHPDRHGFYYSANGAEPASARLREMEHWDWTPAVARYPGGASTCHIALAMGARPIVTSEGKQWVAPCISDPAQVADIPVPDPWDGQTGVVLRSIQETLADLAEGEQLRMPDIQSPLGQAELMWGEPFYFALHEHPGAVHELLGKLCDFTICYIKEIQRLAGDRLNPAGFPPVWAEGTGTMVSDDSMSLLSPEMHREFSMPTVSRIAAECGPTFYHSCSWWPRYFENLHELPNTVAVNWNPANSADPAEMIAEFSGKWVLALHLTAEMHRNRDVVALGRDFADEAAFLEYILDSMRDDTCMYFWLSNITRKEGAIDRVYDLLRDRGYAPECR